MSGREHLLKGLLADSQRGRGLVHCSTTTSSSAYIGPQCSSSIGEEVSISLPLLKLDAGQDEEDSTNLPHRRHPPSYHKVVALPGTIPVDSEEKEEEEGGGRNRGAVGEASQQESDNDDSEPEPEAQLIKEVETSAGLQQHQLTDNTNTTEASTDHFDSDNHSIHKDSIVVLKN